MYDGGRNVSDAVGRAMYASFLSDCKLFMSSMHGVAAEWPVSCEHFLTNEQINRIAWLGQAAACFSLGISRRYRAGFSDLTIERQRAANETARRFLDAWLRNSGARRQVRIGMGCEGLQGWDTGRGACGADGRVLGAELQGDLFGYPEERPRASCAWV